MFEKLLDVVMNDKVGIKYKRIGVIGMKKICFYDSINELTNMVDEFCKENKIRYYYDPKNVTLTVDGIDIKIEEGTYSYRTYSIPKFKYKTLLLEVEEGKEKFEILNLFDYISGRYSKFEQETIWNDMPITNKIAIDNKYKLDGIALIFRDHFLEDNMALLRAFEVCGVAPNDIMVFDKGDKTKHQMEITKTFISRGYTVDILDNSSINDEVAMIHYQKIIESFCIQRKDKKIIIMDDGAIVTKLLNNIRLENVLGIIELTEMGLRRIKETDVSDHYVILDAAKTKLKRSITYCEIANSIFKRIIELLGGTKLVGRTILLLGYGDLGSIVAKRFRELGVNVIIGDIDALKLINAAENGFRTYMDPLEAVKKEKPFMVIGSSGYRSIDKQLIEELPDNSFVTAGATADTLVIDEMKNNGVYEDEQYGVQIHFDKQMITRLGNGRSVNLFLSESIPNQANDIFKAANLLCAFILVENISLKNGLHLEIVDDYLEKSGIYNMYYNLYFKN